MSSGRSKRQVSTKLATRLSALEKLKALKGGKKNKYVVKEEDDVYEEVDEDEYSEMVAKRQQDDWIVDDDGTGYVDDGREIFDDDMDDDESERHGGGRSRGNNNKRIPLKRNESNGVVKKKGDIRSMLLAQANESRKVVKSLDDVKINEDELDDILGAIHSKTHSKPMMSTPKPMKLTKKVTSSAGSSSAGISFNSSNKRSYDTSLTPKPMSSNKKRALDNDGQLKKRSFMNNLNQIDFDDILDDNFFDDSSIVKVKVEKVEPEVEPTVEPTVKSPLKSSRVNNVKTEEKLNESVEWNSSSDNNNDNIQSAPIPAILPKELPYEVDEDGNKCIRFYWFDAHNDYFKNPGLVYLFGKVWIKELKQHVSACVLVKNIERRVYLLPKKEASIVDVQNEFAEVIAKRYKITEYRSRKVTKKYAFEKQDVPLESEYLEVLYPANFSALPTDLTGTTFSHVFGTNTSGLEKFLMDRKLKGPSWLKIKNPEISDPPISWCKIELIVKKANTQIDIEKEQKPSPDFTLVSLNMRTFINPNTKLNEIIGMSCLVNRSFNFDKTSNNKYDSHFCTITKPSSNCNVTLPYDFTPNMALKNYKKTKVESISSERGMLNFFMAKFQQIDPDIIVGHDLFEFDIDLLMSRFSHHKIAGWSKLGRLKRSGYPSRRKDKLNLCGRIYCDIKISSKELIRAKSYDLSQLSAQILKKSRFEVDQHLLPNYYSSSNQLLRLIDLTMKDNDLILNIMYELNVLPLALQITNIAGNLLTRTLLGGRSERNEFLLLHAFNEKNFICPDKTYSSDNKSHEANIDIADGGSGEVTVAQTGKGKMKQAVRRKAAYTGGLVLEPKVGFYDKFILLMDFNSLYPSIIQEYNICFTTVSRNLPVSENDMEEVIPELPSSELVAGILPTEIKKLVDSRREVKRLMSDSSISTELKVQYDIRQKALKLTANSMYGCLGFSHSRFYAKPLAALTTYKGREILMNTKQLVEKLGLEVIYGDTDSIMILTTCLNYDEVKTMGSKIQTEVNRLYKLLEIDIDGVFRSMLLLKKKKYAALTVHKAANGEISYNKEVKGLDIVRRDWSILAKNAGQRVLDEILSTEKTREVIVDDIHDYLSQLASSIRNGDIPIEEFVISKALTKNPEDYPDKKLSHVMVALRYNSSNKTKKLRGGDTVPYVICQDISETTSNANIPATQRAYHPEEMKDNANLKIDVKYYLSQQVHPVVSRLCDPIEGTDSNIIAEFLGLESTVVRNANRTMLENEATFEQGEHKYDSCKSLVFTCVNSECKTDIDIRTTLKKNEVKKEDNSNGVENGKSKLGLTFAKCAKCNIEFNELMAPKFEIQLRFAIEKLINKSYHQWLTCCDLTCNFKTKSFAGQMVKSGLKCPECKEGVLCPELTEAQIHHQLTFFKHLLDLESLEKSKMIDKSEWIHLKPYAELYKKLKNVVQSYLDQCAYNEVDLGFLFRKLKKRV